MAAPSVVTMFRLPPVFRAAWSVVVRDSVWLKLAESGASLAALKLEFDPVPFVSGLEAVSYTHLTLPTICSV